MGETALRWHMFTKASVDAEKVLSKRARGYSADKNTTPPKSSHKDTLLNSVLWSCCIFVPSCDQISSNRDAFFLAAPEEYDKSCVWKVSLGLILCTGMLPSRQTLPPLRFFPKKVTSMWNLSSLKSKILKLGLNCSWYLLISKRDPCRLSLGPQDSGLLSPEWKSRFKNSKISPSLIRALLIM